MTLCMEQVSFLYVLRCLRVAGRERRAVLAATQLARGGRHGDAGAMYIYISMYIYIYIYIHIYIYISIYTYNNDTDNNHRYMSMPVSE